MNEIMAGLEDSEIYYDRSENLGEEVAEIMFVGTVANPGTDLWTACLRNGHYFVIDVVGKIR